MSVTVLKCGQCQKECSIENELFVDTCGHHKCRDCSFSADVTSCCQGVIVTTQTKSMDQNTKSMKFPLKTKKESKISNQTHIVEELSAVGTIQYHCTACRKTFRSRSQKYYHLQCNQPNDAIYECDICKKTFARHSQFKYHCESHASPINECPKCQKTFSNPLALKKHEALHKVEPKPCPHCDKTFLKKISLEQHIAAQHLHQLQYGCAYCNKKYASKSTLQLHLQSHAEKRFKCSFCGKHFQRNSILNLHLKRHSHTGNNYKCKMCDKVFVESGALARHRKIHEEITVQYHCKLCDKNILRKDNMTRHVHTIHPEEKFDDIVLIVRHLAENENDQMSEISEEHHLLVKGQADYEIFSATENKTFAADSPNVYEGKDLRRKNNFVIIENRVLQQPQEMPKIESAFEDCKFDSTNDLSKVTSSIAVNKPEVVTQVQVITPLLNMDEKTDDGLLQNKTNFTKSLIDNAILHVDKSLENPTENHSSLLFNYEQNISFCTPWTRSTSENKMIKVQTPNKQPNLKTEITDIDSQKVSNECKSSLYSILTDTLDQTMLNKASVIRSIGNVKKMLTIPPSSTTVTNSFVPNNVLLDCEYKHKKYSRHYNVDLYRKILGCDDNEDDDNDEDQQQCNHQTEKQDNSCDAANATPVHWRKSFKNSYETSAL